MIVLVKKFLSIFSVFIMSLTNSFAFGGDTHTELTKKAIEYLKNKRNVNRFLTDGDSYLLEKLADSCNIPDDNRKLGVGTLYASHFFDIESNRENISVMSYDKEIIEGVPANALLSLRKFLNQAIEKFTYDSEKAMESLGMAIHYAQDMCCLAHQISWDKNVWKLIKGQHLEYEKAVDNFCKEKSCNLISKNFDFKYSRISNRKNIVPLISIIIGSYATDLYDKCFYRYNMKLYKNFDIVDEEIEIAFKATYELINVFFEMYNLVE